MHRSVVCGVDATRTSRWAARVAGELARELELPLVLVHVAFDEPTFPYGDARLGELQRRRAVETATAMLTGTGAAVADVPVETRVVFGEPADALMSVASDEGAELLVVGSRGRGPLASAALGSVSRRVAATASCPVVVVPSPEAAGRFLSRPQGGRLVCGVDDSIGTVRALRLAGALAEGLALRLSLVHVDPELGPDDAPLGSPAEDRRPLTVVGGAPADVLRRESEDPDATLLVVGSRGRTSWRAALGSVSGDLAARASAPVVVVPPTAEAGGDEVAYAAAVHAS